MHQWCFALSGLLAFHITTVISNNCDSFNNIVVNIKDTDNNSFNRTINGCMERKTFEELKVKELYIRKQTVLVLKKDSVKNMLHLQTLSFWGNKMDSVLPGAFRNLPALKNVQLSYGNIKEIPRGVFDALPAMELLRIHNNEIDIVEDQAFANLVSLKRIYASDNRLEYWNREWFFNTTNLELMDFQANLIRTIPRRAFANLVKLKQIFLDFNEISVIQPDAFKGITQLDYLGLRYNRLTQINEDIFPNDLKIRSFLIDANYLNFLPNEILRKVSVKDITVDNNPWKCPCLDRIKFWLYSTNGTMKIYKICTGGSVPVCSYASSFSQSCFEVVDSELTQRYIKYLRGVNPPLQDTCARLD